VFGQRGEQFQLGDGQRVAGICGAGAASQGAAQPGDSLRQASGRRRGLACGIHAGPAPAWLPGLLREPLALIPAQAAASATAASAAIATSCPAP
jgi:hypothetical protein